MRYYELTPAYGRQDKTAKDAKDSWNAGKDWQGDYALRFQLINKEQFADLTPCTVRLRYDQNRKFATLIFKTRQEVLTNAE